MEIGDFSFQRTFFFSCRILVRTGVSSLSDYLILQSLASKKICQAKKVGNHWASEIHRKGDATNFFPLRMSVM